METSGTEFTLKIRTAITNKLVELGVYVDEELPDYIMVMVANKKSRKQMSDDLSLFLGANTDGFTKWLHSILDILQLNNTAANETKDKTKLDQLSSSPSSLYKKEIKIKETPIQIQEEIEDSITCRNEMENDDLLSKELEEEEQPAPGVGVGIGGGAGAAIKPSNVSQIVKKEVLEEGGGGGISGEMISVVNPVQRSETRIRIMPPLKQIEKTSMRVKPIFHQGKSQLSSTVSSIVRRPRRAYHQFNDNDDDEDDDKYDPCRPAVSSVASVVRVTERRPSLPKERQANKLLLLKAMDEANKSIRTTIKGSVRVEPYQPTPILNFKENTQTVLEEGNKIAVKEIEMEPEEETPIIISSPLPPLTLVDKNVTPPVLPSNTQTQYHQIIESPSKGIKRKLDQEEEMELCLAESVEGPLSSSSQQGATQFVVTLDGVDPKEILAKCKRRVISNQQLLHGEHKNNIDVMLMMGGGGDHHQQLMDYDENIDPLDYSYGQYQDDYMEDEIEEKSLLEEDVDNKTIKKKIRCQFWPACKNAEKCLYNHPSNICKKFPNCSFGARCKDIHPNCKYDRRCSRPDCPFTHTSKPTPMLIPMPPMPVPYVKVLPKPVQCKFFPNCTNANCSFTHPKSCRYGQKCQTPNCSFIHPLVPTPSKLKWASATHILNTTSERRYAVPQKKIEATMNV